MNTKHLTTEQLDKSILGVTKAIEKAPNKNAIGYLAKVLAGLKEIQSEVKSKELDNAFKREKWKI